ncbi:MAG: substrate-binding domain-containing protein [Ignavibacteria bacterium]|nr:substrate-binding domain-containing protein [Ignavibacteria bacterium]
MKVYSNILLIFFASALLHFLSGCDFGNIKSKATIGEMTIEADENLEPVLPFLKDEFQRLNPEAKLNYTVKPTRNVITNLLNKDTKVIMTAGEFNEEDKKYLSDYKIEVQKFEIAVDAVGFIVNPDNPVIRLTSSDLAKIFAGEITLWSEIKAQDNEQNENVLSKMKGDDNKIKVFIQRPNSATYQYVKDTVLMGKDFLKSAVICSTSSQMLQMIRESKNAIGISNLCWLAKGNQDSLDSSVKPLRISRIYPNGRQDDFTELHQGLVFTKKYPYIRKVYVYTTILDISLATGWITFLTNKDGQKVFLEKGLAPVSQPVKVIQIE